MTDALQATLQKLPRYYLRPALNREGKPVTMPTRQKTGAWVKFEDVQSALLAVARAQEETHCKTHDWQTGRMCNACGMFEETK